MIKKYDTQWGAFAKSFPGAAILVISTADKGF
jgi:hypothetical protein